MMHAVKGDPMTPTADIAEAGVILRQGEYGPLTKWDRYPYEIKSSYPYLKALPSPDKIPELIEYIEAKKDLYKVALAQLHCLTRISFEPEYGQSFDASAWRRWWKTVGAEYFQKREIEGVRNENAWSMLVGYDKKFPCPTYKILLPKEWRFEVRFRTGDYMGVQQEIITMERSRTNATLRRRFSTATGMPFQHEKWADRSGRKGWSSHFTPEDADTFLCLIAYAIDHPWFVKRHYSKHENLVEGRSWQHYNSETEWSGVTLPDGRIWWNDDPWHWSGEKNSGIDIQFKTVYLLLCARFRDRDPGWEPDPESEAKAKTESPTPSMPTRK